MLQVNQKWLYSRRVKVYVQAVVHMDIKPTQHSIQERLLSQYKRLQRLLSPSRPETVGAQVSPFPWQPWRLRRACRRCSPTRPWCCTTGTGWTPRGQSARRTWRVTAGSWAGSTRPGSISPLWRSRRGGGACSGLCLRCVGWLLQLFSCIRRLAASLSTRLDPRSYCCMFVVIALWSVVPFRSSPMLEWRSG